jgi:hypothetical protein
MTHETSCGDVEHVKELLAELKAIELWDTGYWRSRRHEAWETVAMIHRRKRRAEILSQLPTFRRWDTIRRIGMVQERERYPRLSFEVDIEVRSETAGVIPGRGVDISEVGMAAILPIELKVGEIVELKFSQGGVSQSTRATVHDRNVFRHGFQFVTPINLPGRR